jgi:hypothetical protein
MIICYFLLKYRDTQAKTLGYHGWESMVTKEVLVSHTRKYFFYADDIICYFYLLIYQVNLNFLNTHPQAKSIQYLVRNTYYTTLSKYPSLI